MTEPSLTEQRQAVGHVLRELREERKLSKLAVARHVGEPLRAVEGWEDGTGPLTFEDLVRLGRLFDVRLTEIAARIGPHAGPEVTNHGRT